MSNRKQRKQNNKDLGKHIGEQLNAFRKEKRLLLEKIELEYDIPIKVMDKIESGHKLIDINYLQYIAAIYDKKLAIEFIDN